MLSNLNKSKFSILIFLLSLIVFWRTVHYDFVWDDERIHITANQRLMNGEVKSFWSKPFSGMYIPMTYSTWSIIKNCFCGKGEVKPAAFHALNILIHSLNCVLLFLLLSILFKNNVHAFVGTLIFMLHPVQVESVAWISEFRGLYATLFAFLSLIVIFNSLDKESSLSPKNFIPATLFFCLALLSKPSVVILPLIVLILVRIFYPQNFKANIKFLSLWLLIIIPITIITSNLQPESGNSVNVPFLEKLVIAGYSFVFYIQKLVFPYPLVACYGKTPDVIMQSNFSLVITTAAFFVLVMIFSIRHIKPAVFASLSIVMVGLLPVAGFVSFDFQQYSSVADRYLYFPMLGFAVGACAILKYHHKALPYISGICIVFLILTIKQTGIWKNEFILWDNTISHYQNVPSAYYNRGVEYSKVGKFDEAISDYDKALELKTTFKDALFNRANAYENKGDVNSAFNDYGTYLKLDSTDGSVYFKRAHLNYKVGDIKDAILDAQKAEFYNFPVSDKFKQKLLGN